MLRLHDRFNIHHVPKYGGTLIYWKNTLPPPSPHSLGGILVDFYFWEREYEKKRKGLKSRCEKREGKMKDKILPKRLK
jgi:hypothetical protein